MIVGIDNGLNGGIVALSPIRGLAPVFAAPLPTLKHTYPARKHAKAKEVREIDVRALVDLFRQIQQGNDQITVFFEHCPFHADRADTMRSMALSAGKILAVLEARGIATHRILSFDWHPVVLGKIPRGKSKETARAAAAAFWPGEKFFANSRCNIGHDGMIDAALIAEYGRRINTREVIRPYLETLQQPDLIP